jgi:hypothetical protein
VVSSIRGGRQIEDVENRMPRRIFGPMKEEVTRNTGKN